MKFLIAAIIAWFRNYDIPCVIYGADGQSVDYWGVEPKKNYWPKRLDEVSKASENWYAYPINANGEYCGCICWEYNDNIWEVEEEIEKPDFYTDLAICHLLEVACDLDENS